MNRFLLTQSGILATSMIACPAFGQPTAYTAIPISDGSVGVGYWIVGTDLNKNGSVCGMASTYELNFLASKPWVANIHAGTLQEIAPEAGASDYLYAGAINDKERVLGYYLAPGRTDSMAGSPATLGVPVPFGMQSHAIQWHTDGSGGFDAIPGLGSVLGIPALGNIVFGFNNNGACVGSSREADGPFGYTDRAFLFDFVGPAQDLSDIGPPGTHISLARDINDNGQVCGEITLADGSVLAFVTDSRLNVTILPSMFNNPRGTEYASSAKVNDAGQVIGVASLLIEPENGRVEIVSRGFLWDSVNGMVDLGSVNPTAINAQGQIVASGMVQTTEGLQSHALVRDEAGRWIDLNDLVQPQGCNARNWLSRAPAINDNGEILVIEDWCLDSIFVVWRTHVLVPRPCAADVTRNGQVNVDDLLAIINFWGNFCQVSSCPGDIAPGNGDGIINIDDLLAVINGWAGCE